MLPPKSVIPLAVLFTGNLAVPRRGIKAGMAQVFLQQSDAVARIIHLHGMNAEGVPQAMRTNASYFPSLWIYKVWQTSPPGAIPDYLPRSVPVDIEETGLNIICTQFIDITLDHR